MFDGSSIEESGLIGFKYAVLRAIQKLSESWCTLC
jgi:hypothetical protein